MIPSRFELVRRERRLIVINPDSDVPPKLANDLFRNLEVRISALETAIADRREVYNDAVNAQHVRLETFPDMLVGRLCQFRPAAMLEFEASETGDVDLKPVFGR